MAIARKTKLFHLKQNREEEPAGIKLLKLAGAVVGFIILLVILGVLWFLPMNVSVSYETPYDTCIAAGNPMLKTYPPKCVWPGGQTVTQIIPGVNDIRTFDDCVGAGYPVMESYPEQCRTFEGKTFTRTISETVRFQCQTKLQYEGPTPELSAYDAYTAQCSGYFTPESCMQANVEHGCEWKEAIDYSTIQPTSLPCDPNEPTLPCTIEPEYE